MSADVTSAPLTLTNMLGYAVQAQITGTPTGTLKLQGSCDVGIEPVNGVVGPVIWVDIGAAMAPIVGAATNILYNEDATYYRWVRLVYVRTAGSGLLTATMNGKGF